MTTPQHRSYLKLPANYAELSRVDQRRWIAQAATHIQATIAPPPSPDHTRDGDRPHDHH